MVKATAGKKLFTAVLIFHSSKAPGEFYLQYLVPKSSQLATSAFQSSDFQMI